jgi:transposase
MMFAMKIELTADLKKSLEKRHRVERDARVCDRIKAVLLNSEGWTNQQIAQALRIHSETVAQHLQDWHEAEKLKPENGGSSSHLSQAQEKALDAHLQEHVQTTVRSICAWVFKQFQVSYTVSGMTAWLHRNGFSYKQPKGIPAKVDLAQQEAFIEQYLELVDQSSAEQPIVFIDAVHPTMVTKISHGWIKKGQDKLIATTASRTRVNVIGAIELNTLQVTHSIVDTVNAQTVGEVFQKLKLHYPHATTIHVVLDRAGYHRSQVLKDLAESLNIELHYLPPYSPNLNPIERLWKVLNETTRNNVVFESAKQFRQAISDFFDKTIPSIPETLRSRINDNFQTLQSTSSS